MKKLSKILIVVIISLISSTASFSQEVLIELGVNNEIQEIIKKRGGLKKSYSLKADTITNLPFIDEFSKTQVYPDSSLWLDNFVYINSTYANNPLSIGIATFDAIDADGKVYEHASTNSFEADVLTSKPIDLNYSVDKNIFLSFLYQPAGIGNPPEYEDSLVLQYYSPSDSVWTSVWKASYFENDSLVRETNYLDDNETVWEPSVLPSELFRHVIAPIDETRFLQKGFQFRLKNYASLSNVSYLKSLRGNCDLWHIDYLRLDTLRTSNDTIIEDVAFKYPLTSLLKNYESIPWTHYNGIIEDEQFMLPIITIRNNYNAPNEYTDLEMKIEDLYGDNLIFNYNYGGNNIDNPYSNYPYLFTPLNYNFATSNSLDSARFIINLSFQLNGNPWNDSIKYEQVFNNYYAYDDGSAEYGYGLYGEGTKYGQVAYKFKNYDTSDTLRGVMMYFNRSFEDASEKYFYLAVWDHNDTVPGNLLLHQEGAKPEYNGINQFETYLFEEPLVVTDTFYVGWTKTTEETINIGFDKNRINNDKIFYNYDGTWNKSQIEGTVMIRPIFSKEILTGLKPSLENVKFNLYPNPANDIIYLDNLPDKNYVVSLFDNVGRKILESNAPVSQLDVSNLTSGVYHIRITDFETFIANQKLLLIH